MTKTTEVETPVTDNEEEEETLLPANDGPVSIWLYLAGLCVTLSGLYAVNFGIEERGFAQLTYTLAITGYVLSYIMRVRRLSMQILQVPLVIILVFLFITGLSSDQGLGWFAPASVTEDRAKSLQLIFAWLAIIHTFTLSADAAVLFACVPCMTMIALVSTTTTETNIQNAFLVFICAATFLMVHENYLRTRTTMIRGRTPTRERHLFNGQIQLAAFCFVGALVLANIVSVPLRSLGQRLLIPSAMNSFVPVTQKGNAAKASNVKVDEKDSLELSRGPVAENDTQLLRIHCDRGLYWRGTTFDYYTGHSFENHAATFDHIDPGPPVPANDDSYPGFDGSDSRGNPANRFVLPPSPLELKDSEMEGSTTTRQEVHVLGGLSAQIYGAGNVQEVRANLQSLRVNPARNLVTYDTLKTHSNYLVISQIADDNPDHLRAAPAAPIPPAIAAHYLGVAPGVNNPQLRALVHSITRDQKTNYDKVIAIKEYISTTCKYNLQAPAAPTTADRVEYFLTESKQGYCDSFGAAMTVLCRYAGIPSRLASGFLTGDLDSNGEYIVREKHKHIWTEVFFPKIGWVTFDATEGADDISNHDGKAKQDQKGFLAWLSSQGFLPPLLGVVIIGSLLYVLKTELWDRLKLRRALVILANNLPPTNAAIVQSYLAACTILARHGYVRALSTTPGEFESEVRQRTEATLPELNEALEELTALCTRFRYGGQEASEGDVESAKLAASKITQVLAGVKKQRVIRLPSKTVKEVA